MQILIAGVGNVLKGDDGFGVRAAEAMKSDPRLTADMSVVEYGIGGIHLVQELMRGYDALILFDAFDRGGRPGQLFVVEPTLPDLANLSERERRDFFSETHYAVPLRALTFAREVKALPDIVRIIGCQPRSTDAFGQPMCEEVGAAIGPAIDLAFEAAAAIRSGSAGGSISVVGLGQ